MYLQINSKRDLYLQLLNFNQCGKIFPEIAAASAAVKLGSFVNEEAICSTRNCCNSGESNLGFAKVLASIIAIGFAFTKSRETACADEDPGAAETTAGAMLTLRAAAPPEVASIWDGCGWLCSPSYVATRTDWSSTLLWTYKLNPPFRTNLFFLERGNCQKGQKKFVVVVHLLFNRAARSKRAFEISSRTRIISSDFLTIFPPLISIFNNLQNLNSKKWVSLI